jgi:hypothetical protein
MIEKHLLRPERVRRVPAHFSWIDHRLIRDHHLPRADARAWALYLVLVTVGDERGLSYYSDASLGRLLSLSPDEVRAARGQLLATSLLAHEAPLYQVLALEAPPRPFAARAAHTAHTAHTARTDDTTLLDDIARTVRAGGAR